MKITLSKNVNVSRSLRHLLLLPVLGVAVIIGIYNIHKALASTAATGSEAESGVVTTAAIVNDTKASAGKAVRFSTVGFNHPGILVSLGQLNYVKNKIQTNQQPWTNALQVAVANGRGSLTYTPKPWTVVECGSYSNPNYGCSDETNDAIASYTQSLLWYYTGQTAYADNAIKILNAWSGTVTAHTNSNAPLQSAWAAEHFTRAAEIIRYTSTRWPQTDISKFETMLKTAYLPYFVNGSPTANGNWELSMAEATMNVGVFTNDKAVFNKGVSLWRGRVPAYIYLASDGTIPVAPPGGKIVGADKIACYWLDNAAGCSGSLQYFDGQIQETCRDFDHLGMGLGAMVNAAETARIQGINLYGEQKDRIVKGLEFTAKYNNGATPPAGLCGGIALKTSKFPSYEIAYNEYANRSHMAMPNTLQYITSIRPTGTSLVTAWETLTHADSGSAAL